MDVQVKVLDSSLFLPKYKRIAVLIPTYKVVYSVCFHQFMMLLNRLWKEGFVPGVFMVNADNVVDARNSLVNTMLKAHLRVDYSLVLWLGDDLLVDYNMFLRLLNHFEMNEDIGILSARYLQFSAQDPEKGNVCAFYRDVNDYVPVPLELEKIVEVDACGFGTLFVDPKIHMRMHELYGPSQFMMEEWDGVIYGEDIIWCERIKEDGKKIYLDNSVKIGHAGGKYIVRL